MSPDREQTRPKEVCPRRGFTLIEVMVVISIAGILATMALQNYAVFVTRTRRTEAYTVLNALNTVQEEFYANHGTFSGSFVELAFEIKARGFVIKVEEPTHAAGLYYTYELSQPVIKGKQTSWKCIATANLDDDEAEDILEIEDSH